MTHWPIFTLENYNEISFSPCDFVYALNQNTLTLWKNSFQEKELGPICWVVGNLPALLQIYERSFIYTCLRLNNFCTWLFCLIRIIMKYFGPPNLLYKHLHSTSDICLVPDSFVGVERQFYLVTAKDTVRTTFFSGITS